MLKDLLFKPDPVREHARAILTALIAAARDPALFGPGRIPDTFDGRFQLVALYGVLLMRRLRDAPEAAALAQHFSDQLFRSFDDGLREAGVGDISVPKHMKKMARALYGRLGAYDQALSEAGREGALATALSRNIWDSDAAPFAPELASRTITLAERLAQAPVQSLAEPAVWQGR
jgi:cytochrome b pre-mRNA-processing protein 3